MKLTRCFNIGDLRRLARRRLPAPLFHYLDGGADDEWTLRRNTQAFDDYQLLPRQLTGGGDPDTGVTVLGCKLEWPVLLSPTGMSRLFHHEAEPAVARAAAKSGTLYSLSTVGTTSIEGIAAATSGPKMFQVYVFRDRGLTEEFVQRCRAAKYNAMCLTVDTPVAGNRERDHVTGMTMPPKLTLKSLWSFAAHPHWSLNYLLHPDFRLANVIHRVDALAANPMPLIDYVNSQFDRDVSWEHAEWLAKEWNGPFVIKGIMTVEDARRALDIGASAVMISNHGGRQLDSVPAPVDCLAAIADALGDRLEIIADGGIRRGTHVLKALALGASACSIGRPYLYGLAAGGERGVDRALQLLRSEVERGMILLGAGSIGDLSRDFIRQRI